MWLEKEDIKKKKKNYYVLIKKNAFILEISLCGNKMNEMCDRNEIWNAKKSRMWESDKRKLHDWQLPFIYISSGSK